MRFNIIPNSPGATFAYKPISTYTVGDVAGKTILDTGFWLRPLPLNGTQLFKLTLFAWSVRSDIGVSGWDFQYAKNPLKGSFEIVSYVACGFQDSCGREAADVPVKTNGVGALLYLFYHPAGSDPRPGQGKIHWIQMVDSNTRLFPFIDNKGRTESPYYGLGNHAGETYLKDRPFFPTAPVDRRANYFTAQLYLVEETTPPGSKKRSVTIHSGIQWSWKNEVSRICPTKSSDNSKACPPPPPPPSCNGNSGGGGCPDRNIYGLFDDNDSADTELPISDIDSEFANNIEDTGAPFESPESIPEPTSALALLALGASGII